jgi:hypothetical protein
VKIASLLFFFVFLLFAALQLNDESWLIWSLVYLLSAYTSGCSFKDYYNPMLLMLMVSAYFIAFLFVFPAGEFLRWFQNTDVSSATIQNLVFMKEMTKGLGLLICSVINTWFMFIGFGKAKKPGYNHAFSVSIRSK